VTESSAAPRELAARITAVAGMDRLLPALQGLDPSYLVGGAVRDLLLGKPSVDLDVAVEGDARQVARELARRLGGEATEHERFGTATVRAEGIHVDLATTRRESYSGPGALPDVEPAGLGDDLARRDFTINAMAAGLSGDAIGDLHDPHGGARDLDARVVRVLHVLSFRDDPTRLLRAVRYELRLGFRMDSRTKALAREAAQSRAFATVSGARIRDELLDLLREPEAPAGIGRLRELGLDEALHEGLRADAELAAGAALGAAETGADRVLAELAALSFSIPDRAAGWLEQLHLPAATRDAVSRAARDAREIARTLSEQELTPAELHALLQPEPPEALALALALGAPARPVLRYVSQLRSVRLEVTGDDLLAAGVPESPAVGRALAEVLRRKLDGQVAGREEELRLALELAREHT
jgi:tRNA nucleotidyltransferase (CCA-adding enzyme)